MGDERELTSVGTGIDTEPEVAVDRWDSAARPPDPAAMADGVAAFATLRGLAETRLPQVTTAVSEAVLACSPVGSQAPHACAVIVEMAADGIWLTVRVTGAAPWDAEQVGRRLRHAHEIADRVELSPSWDGRGTSVLLEMPMLR